MLCLRVQRRTAPLSLNWPKKNWVRPLLCPPLFQQNHPEIGSSSQSRKDWALGKSRVFCAWKPQVDLVGAWFWGVSCFGFFPCCHLHFSLFLFRVVNNLFNIVFFVINLSILIIQSVLLYSVLLDAENRRSWLLKSRSLDLRKSKVWTSEKPKSHLWSKFQWI